MSSTSNLRRQAEVYAQIDRFGESGSHQITSCSVSIVTEATAQSLARIFDILGILGTMTLVPSYSQCRPLGDDALALDLDFSGTRSAAVSVSCRKLGQLTETISVEVAFGS